MLEILNCCWKIIYVEREMMPTYVTVFRLNRNLIWRFVLKYLEVRPMFTPKEPQPAHNGARVDIKVVSHPIVIGDKGTELEHKLAAVFRCS